MTTIDANNKPSAAVDTGNIIAFPDRRAAHQQPEKTESRPFSRPLRQAVRRFKDAVLRLISTAPAPQGVPGSAVAAAADHAEQHSPPLRDHRGRPIRERVSA